MLFRRSLALLTCLAVVTLHATASLNAATIGDICRIKGQETNTLHGTGLVVGLPGTGDGEAPTTRALARTLTLLGAPVGGDNGAELRNMKNIALVYVTAQVSSRGGQQGEVLDVRVSALGAKSLAGGYLLTCALTGPLPGDDRVFAQASGVLTIEDRVQPTIARVSKGAKLVRDVPHGFYDRGLVTLVLEDKHAGFKMAQEVEYAINEDKEFEDQKLAKAIDAKTILVRIPDSYKDSEVLFASAIKSMNMEILPREKRIVINEKSGVIVIGDRVEILPVAISHKNLTIEVGGERQSQFVPLNPMADTGTESLKSLVSALNALRVSNPDMIEIIKTLDREGAIYGKLIIE